MKCVTSFKTQSKSYLVILNLCSDCGLDSTGLGFGLVVAFVNMMMNLQIPLR